MKRLNPFTLLPTMGITFEQLSSYPQHLLDLQSYSYSITCMQGFGTQG